MDNQQLQEIELKRAWLRRYLDSLKRQQRIMDQIEEARDRATSIHSALNPVYSAPTGTHSDRVADAVQEITALEKRLQSEQQRGVQAAAEIIAAIFALPFQSSQVLNYRYIYGMTTAQIAKEMRLVESTIYKYSREGLELLQMPDGSKAGHE